MRLRIRTLIAFALQFGGATYADEKPADESAAQNAKGVAFFESKIRPVLVQHCYQCHSASSGKSEGSLLLDTKNSVLAGGDRGPSIVPGDPDASVLLTAISHSDPDLKMPPKKDRLPDAVLVDFKQWIAMGAPDPRVHQATGPRPAIDIDEGRKFWAFQPPVRHDLPPTRDRGWAKRDLDHFVLAKLDANGLSPSPDADPATLLRRLHFDLIGLPPSPAKIDEFKRNVESQGLDRATEIEVDALLASKYFGETWGRHWLDVARFAESSGKEANISFPYAFRYRDYVIDCVNEDKPFNRFVMEQIAGDLLPYDSDKERARLLIATAFLAMGPKNLEEGNERQFRADLIDEQIDSVTRAVMAQSVACARCHDHKFDPFAMEDYYALAGVFASTRTFFGTMVSPANRVGGDPLELPRVEGQPVFHKGIPADQVQKLKAELKKLRDEKPTTLTDALRIFWRSGAIEGQLESVDDKGQPLPLTMGVLDSDKIIDAPLLERGDIARPTKPIARGFPRVVELKDAPPVPPSQSGRLEFAQWLTSPDHPLPARVMANRIWHHLFGAGIVRTVDNFGITGERPSHPELLDYLAIRFVEGGWSTKALVREIVLSRAYRQSSAFDEAKFKVDPDNRWLWRAKKRRLDAEAIRDAMLFVAGQLDSQRPAGSLVARQIGDRPISLIGLDPNIPADLDDGLHRSVYLPILRDRLPDILDLFDFAEPSLVTGDRDTTNVPVQALYLMNSPFVQARAKAFARRLETMSDADEQRVRDAFAICYGRAPQPDELAVATEFLQRGNQRAQDDKALREQVLMSYCQALLSTAEFRNLD